MILTIRFVSDEVDNFVRDIRIDADSTFLELRNTLCRATGFSTAQMHSFFICDEESWEKQREITLEDMGSDTSQDVYLMQDTPLSDFLDDEGQRLIFVFDYMMERALFGEVKRVTFDEELLVPVIATSRGDAPEEQVEIEPFDAGINETPVIDPDAEFYGDSEYNDDELDQDFIDDPVLD